MSYRETNAGILYEVYCQAVGGKAFNGDPLPNWETFRNDPNKKVQSDAWVQVAKRCETLFNNAPMAPM